MYITIATNMNEIRHCYRCGAPMEPGPYQGHVRPICTGCGMVHFLDPKVVAGVIIEMERKLVMIKRNLEPGLGLWTFPSGFVDRGEVVEEAAKREVKEETGLDVALTELVGIYSRDGDTNILVVYAGKASGGQLQAGEEAQEVGLFDPNVLPPQAFEHDTNIIQQWLQGKTLTLP